MLQEVEDAPEKSIRRKCKQKLRALAVLSMDIDVGKKLEYLLEQFSDYLREIEQDEDYKCRFKYYYLPNLRRKLEGMFDGAVKLGYRYAVFLTLTTDPKRFKDPIEAIKAITVNFNRFRAWVRKKVGFNPPYIRVLELGKNLYPHLHVVFFGVERIADIKEIEKEWNRLGQGKFAWIVRSEYRDGRWVCEGEKLGKGDLKSYLTKYLRFITELDRVIEKAVTMGMRDGVVDHRLVNEYLDNYFLRLAIYWVAEKRFFTASRCLTDLASVL